MSVTGKVKFFNDTKGYTNYEAGFQKIYWDEIDDFRNGILYEVRQGDVHYCHGSPLNIEEFDYIFARDQAAQCMSIWDSMPQLTVIGHSHLCKGFALNPEHAGAQEVVAQEVVARGGLRKKRCYEKARSLRRGSRSFPTSS